MKLSGVFPIKAQITVKDIYYQYHLPPMNTTLGNSLQYIDLGGRVQI